ncbi:hypothetical protein FPOA_02366 [Fusarium poae]|uniref:BTB domain-containing protein n=1 Tax=Fusarium poae TaxID=36050 RepID=A0A1B8B6R4_FUSPO|nr:hypothetical protein FPOA_02366 [Fusarium poae]
MTALNEIIDPDGDTLIIIPYTTSSSETTDASETTHSHEGTDTDTVTETRFKVSRNHLTVASRRAKRMFQGEYLETQKSEIDGCYHWKFEPIFDPEALGIVLRIMHASNQNLPDNVTLEMLVSIGKIVDDLQCHEALSFFVKVWTSRIGQPIPHYMCKSLIQWIFVASVFKFDEYLRKATRVALMDSTGHIDSLGLPIISDIIDKIEKKRHDLLKDLADQLHSSLQNLCSGSHCNEPQFYCDLDQWERYTYHCRHLQREIIMVLASLSNWRAQWFPPKPKFTEQDVPAQNGRVFLVTGGNAGIGYELVKMLYGTGATIYMTSRSIDRAESAIKTITSLSPPPSNPGTIKPLCLDLNDLESVQHAAETFVQQESRLDVLWNNAGTGGTAVEMGAKTKQGLETMVGSHCVAALLFTQLLIPQLRAAAASSARKSSRVVWTSSFLAEAVTPTNGIDFDFLKEGSSDRVQNYGVSKLGNWMLSREMTTRYAEDGIISVTQNPGNLKAGAYAGTPAVAMFLMKIFLHDPKLGAYTELYSGLSPDITNENNGCYIIPWGRIRSDDDCPRRDIMRAMTPQSAGGLGYTGKFWDWCERQWQPFVGDVFPG